MLIFSMPGSESAVRLAMTRMILPELGHAAGLVAPQRRGKVEHGSRRARSR
jgi:molybdopterin biosynthesis enzyme MoaB